MKKLDVDKFLEENAVEIALGGKTYIVKDLEIKDAEALALPESDKKGILAKVIGCEVDELDSYGAIGIMKIVTFLNENLLPKASQ